MNEISVMVGPNKPEYLRDCFPPSVELTAGDTKMMWNKDNPDEVEAARVTFNKLTAKGYLAFHVTGKDGEKGERMKTFDPDAERIIMIPKVQGG